MIGAVAGGAVERLLDREHVRVGCRLLEEALHRGGERVVGVVQQHVVAAYGVEHVDRRGRLDLGQLAVGGRHERGVLQVLAAEVGDPVQPGEVEGPGETEDLLGVDPELGDEQVEDPLVDGLLDLQAHGRAEAAAQQLLLQGLEQVLGVVLLDLQVLVAGDPEGVGVEHLHAREQSLEVLADDVLQRDEPLVAERHEALEDRRDLDPREVLGAGLGVAHDDREVEREPGDVGERVRRVDGERGQHREDPVLEEPLGHLLLVAVEVGPPHQADVLLGERRDDAVGEEGGLALHQLAGARPQTRRGSRAAAGPTRHGRRRRQRCAA